MPRVWEIQGEQGAWEVIARVNRWRALQDIGKSQRADLGFLTAGRLRLSIWESSFVLVVCAGPVLPFL